MATENTGTEKTQTNESDYCLNQIDMAMKAVSILYFKAKSSDDNTSNGISSESWLENLNYLGNLIRQQNATPRSSGEQKHSDI